MSYVINLWDRFTRQLKGIDTHLLQDYCSVLKGKIPTVRESHRREDTRQSDLHQRLSKVKTQMVEKDLIYLSFTLSFPQIGEMVT